MADYLWHHGIDLEQDAVIETAIVLLEKEKRLKVDRHTMTKLIITKYGERLQQMIDGKIEKDGIINTDKQ